MAYAHRFDANTVRVSSSRHRVARDNSTKRRRIIMTATKNFFPLPSPSTPSPTYSQQDAPGKNIPATRSDRITALKPKSHNRYSRRNVRAYNHTHIGRRQRKQQLHAGKSSHYRSLRAKTSPQRYSSTHAIRIYVSVPSSSPEEKYYTLPI